MSLVERRCPSCRALVAEDATWCGQCLEPLPVPEAGPEPATETVETSAVDTDPEGRPGSLGRLRAATWACPACEHENAMDLDRCEACGTPFAQLFAEPEERVQIAPARAMAWSLLWPGLGHWKAGHRLDGVARMVLFAWTLGTVVVFLASSSGGGLGSGTALFVLFLAASVLLYVVAAVDARRIASGEDPLVSSRVLVWVSVGLVVASVVLAMLVTLPAARGG